MLVIQNIVLYWKKEERKAEYAKLQQQFQQAYLLESVAMKTPEVFVQTLRFYQQTNQIRDALQQNDYRWQQLVNSRSYLNPKQMQGMKERLIQNKLYIKNHQSQFYDSVEDLNLTNLHIKQKDSVYEVSFFYDERRCGAPVRFGHNRDYHNEGSRLFRCNTLNETAFTLMEGQYGRILYNERRVEDDTGEWYYQLHSINLKNLMNDAVQADLFLAQKPDYMYTQLANLF